MKSNLDTIDFVKDGHWCLMHLGDSRLFGFATYDPSVSMWRIDTLDTYNSKADSRFVSPRLVRFVWPMSEEESREEAAKPPYIPPRPQPKDNNETIDEMPPLISGDLFRNLLSKFR